MNISAPATRLSRTRNSGTLRAAGSMSVAIFLSRVLGLVREQVFAVLFGAGNATDAFNIAFRIPNLLRNLFAEGAMSASLVPTFTRARIEEGDERAWRVAGLVFRVLAAFVGILAAFGVFFAADLVNSYASAFHSVPGKFELTVRLTRLMFPFFPLVALAAAFMGILNACGSFFLPALSSALFNFSSIAIGIICAKLIAQGHDLGFGLQPIEGMAIGVLFGGAIQAFCQLPQLYRHGYRFPRGSHPAWYRDPALRRMLALMVPGVVGLAATQISVLINTILATSQGPGAVSWLNYAFRLMQFPIGVFGVSLATATLPVVSGLWVKKDIQGVQDTLTQGLRHIFAINLPASAGLICLGYPIIEMLFQYGKFQASDTQATAMALVMYSLGLTAYSVVKLLVPACYALGNARVPVVASLITIGITLLFNLLLVRSFGYWGLALATSIGAVVNGLILIAAIRRWIRRAGGAWAMDGLGRSFLANFVVSVLMAVCVHFSYAVLKQWIPGESAGIRLFRVALMVIEGGGCVVIFALGLGVSEVADVLEFVKKKLKGPRSGEISELR